MHGELVALVASVEETRDAVVAAATAVSDEQAAFRPDGGWSIAEVIEHLYRAELTGIARMWQASAGVRAGRRWDGALPHRGKRIEQVVEETWKAKETAPPAATPGGDGPLRLWVMAFLSLRDLLAGLERQLDGLPLDDVVFPHPLSGPLDARQRLEFLRYHMERHISQIQRIKESPDFPDAHV